MNEPFLLSYEVCQSDQAAILTTDHPHRNPNVILGPDVDPDPNRARNQTQDPDPSLNFNPNAYPHTLPQDPLSYSIVERYESRVAYLDLHRGHRLAAFQGTELGG